MKMDIRKFTFVAILISMLIICGCAKNTEPVAPPQELSTAQKNFDAVWQASIDVLYSMDFVIEKQDRRTGLIKTQPLLGKHYIELWRKDSGSAAETLTSTISPRYHTVTVQIAALPNNQFAPEVTVDVELAGKELKNVKSTSAAYKMLILPGQKKYRKQTVRKDKQLEASDEIGKSPKLAEKIKKMIVKRSKTEKSV